MPTEAENLAATQTLYANLVANLNAALAAGALTMSVDGVTLDLSGAADMIALLAKIPGVAQLPVYTVVSVAR